jgi:hypothetical protein
MTMSPFEHHVLAGRQVGAGSFRRGRGRVLSQTWVDLDDICRDTGLNVKTVRGALKRLQAPGFIQRK